MSKLDTAKENYAYGRHQTISADRAEQLYPCTVRASTEQFVCAECGEYVTFVRRKNYKSYFKHGKKNEMTSECELRSSNQSYNSIYERLGLPMYIRKYMNGRFELCIGFYNLEESLFESVEKASLRITINPLGLNNHVSKKVSLMVNRNNFLSGMTTLQKIAFIAPRYTINYSIPQYEEMLKQRWGNYVEGILTDGTLFTFHDNGGRKIRINDQISTDTEYLYLCRNENLLGKHSEDISYTYYGTISLQSNGRDVIYNVYKIVIRPQNDHQFRVLFKFCRDHFKVTLNYKTVSFEALWPPTIQEDQQINCIMNRDYFFVLKSDNLESLSAFSHKGPEFEEIEGKVFNKNSKLMSLSIPSEGLTVTVGEKYNSIHSIIKRCKGEIKSYRNSFLITDLRDNPIEAGQTYDIPYNNCIKISSDSKSSILHFHNNSIYQYFIEHFAKFRFSIEGNINYPHVNLQWLLVFKNIQTCRIFVNCVF